MRQHGDAFGSAVGFEAAAQVDAGGGGDFAGGFGDADAGDGDAVHGDGFDADRQRRRGARGDQRSEAGQGLVIGMQAAGAAVVFDAEPQLAAVGVGQAHQGFDQFAVRKAMRVALELDGQRFLGWQRVDGHGGWRLGGHALAGAA